MSTINNDHPKLGLLRFTTAGSVDDGKSTLIGRMLYDSKSIFEDQMEALEESSKRRGNEDVDLALLTDGLRAEREQGITIDVAYRYFATPKRKFIIADTPGHIQYTRNMVTGASTANLAVILVDARHGVLEQTLRHTYIASLLSMKHIVFCVNKMDLVDYSEESFISIKGDLEALATKLNVEDTYILPISARDGDNVVEKSENMPWYKGETFLHILENVEIYNDADFDNPRFPVQYVIRPQVDEYHDYRGYAGRIAGGTFKPGDKVTVLPSLLTSTVKSVDLYNQPAKDPRPGDSVCITLEDDIDISRGDMLVAADNQPKAARDLELMVCWFNERPLQVRGKYVLRHTSNEARCVIGSVESKVNISTLEDDATDKEVKMNDIARIKLKTNKPIFFDPYKKNTTTGSLILIDEATNETVAAGMIIDQA